MKNKNCCSESDQGELCRQTFLRFRDKGRDVDLRPIMVKAIEYGVKIMQYH